MTLLCRLAHESAARVNDLFGIELRIAYGTTTDFAQDVNVVIKQPLTIRL